MGRDTGYSHFGPRLLLYTFGIRPPFLGKKRYFNYAKSAPDVMGSRCLLFQLLRKNIISGGHEGRKFSLIL
jgi:hypothetical protein